MASTAFRLLEIPHAPEHRGQISVLPAERFGSVAAVSGNEPRDLLSGGDGSVFLGIQ